MAYDKVVDSAALDAALVGIADAIRRKTGGTDPLTLDGMTAAIASITVGDGNGGGLAYDMGEFVFDTDSEGKTTSIHHALGERPSIVIVWTDDLVGVTNPDSKYATQCGFIWFENWMGLNNWGTTKAEFSGTTVSFQQVNAGTGMTVTKPTSYAYTIDAEDVTDTRFPLLNWRYVFYRAGLTYKYLVAKPFFNVGGVVNAD